MIPKKEAAGENHTTPRKIRGEDHTLNRPDSARVRIPSKDWGTSTLLAILLLPSPPPGAIEHLAAIRLTSTRRLRWTPKNGTPGILKSARAYNNGSQGREFDTVGFERIARREEESKGSGRAATTAPISCPLHTHLPHPSLLFIARSTRHTSRFALPDVL